MSKKFVTTSISLDTLSLVKNSNIFLSLKKGSKSLASAKFISF